MNCSTSAETYTEPHRCDCKHVSISTNRNEDKKIASQLERAQIKFGIKRDMHDEFGCELFPQTNI